LEKKIKRLTHNIFQPYDAFHQGAHPYLQKVQQEFGFYDVFLISDTGDVVYSVFKEIDFGTSLTTGPFKDSGLAKAFTNSLNNDGVSFTDFSLYMPSYQAPAGFLSVPVFKNEKRIGVLVAQFPISTLNNIMTERAGLGENR